MLVIRLKDGRTIRVPTDKSWEAAEKITGNWRLATDSQGWAAALELGPCGMPPWGEPEFMPAVHNVFPNASLIHKWLAGHGLPPDFNATHTLRYIHRHIGDTDVYFVANGTTQSFQATCSFRVTGKQPELWHPETGTIADVPFYEEHNGCTDALLEFRPYESVFVVFRRPGKKDRQVVAVRRGGRDLMRLDPPTQSSASGDTTETFTISRLGQAGR